MKNFLVSLVSILIFNNSFGQINYLINEDSVPLKLNEVTVVAQKIKTKNLIVPYSVSAVQQTEFINYQYRTTPEALMATNGIFVQKTNHGGGSPFIRGVTGNQILILTDGIRINNATFRYGPNQYLNTIDAYTIHKIEVAKGTGSVQYGTDAIGGVINVISNSPTFSDNKKHFSSRVVSKYTTGNIEKTLRVETAFSSKKTAFAFGVTSRNFGDLIGGDTTGKQTPSGYKELAYDAKLKVLLKTNSTITIVNQFLRQSNVPIFHKVKIENFKVNEINPQQRTLTYLRWNASFSNKIFKEVESTLSLQQNKEIRINSKNGSSTIRNEKDVVSSIGFLNNVTSEINKFWKANSGIEFYFDKVKSKINDFNTVTGIDIFKRGLYPNNASLKNYSIFSLHHLNFNKWVIDFGLRYNLFKIRIEDTSIGSTLILPKALIGNAAILYKLNEQNSLYASINNGFRAPNIDDLGTLGIVDFRYELPTSNLAPEKSTQSEIGYKLQTNKITATAAIYYTKINNIITRVKSSNELINGYAVYRKENVEKAYITGIEATIQYQFLKKWSIYCGSSYTYGQNVTKNEPLRRIPPFNGKLSGMYNLGKWFVSGEMQFASTQKRLAQGDKDDNRIPIGGTPGWNIINFYGGYKTKFIEANISFQNITNEDYRTHGSGINGMGRSVSLSLIFKLIK